jgi:hypothetical protein
MSTKQSTVGKKTVKKETSKQTTQTTAVATPAPAPVATPVPTPAPTPAPVQASEAKKGGVKKAVVAKKAPATKKVATKKASVKKVTATKKPATKKAPVKKAVASKKGGSKKEVKKEVKQETVDEENSKTRFFKVIVDQGEAHGRFSGTKPKQAANKALTSILKSRDQNGGASGEIKFSIVECTRGSKHKRYNYVGQRVKLDKPMKVTIGSGVGAKEIEYKFNNRVMKDKTAVVQV